MLEASEILFMGLGKSAVLWYRCALPAIHLGADWVGVHGHPPGVQVMTGVVKGDTKLPHYDDYRVVVIQQPWGRAWMKQIKKLQERGIKVLYEVDDYLHGVAKQPHHDYARFFTKERLKGYEMCMRVSDGIICSTDYIARRYARYNRNLYVCKNGLDLARYRLTRPERETVNVIWAGATGHMDAILPWLNAIFPVMRDHEEVCLVTIGQPGIAEPINEMLGNGRAIGIPFAPIECYPSAMAMGDIALAPATTTNWYRGKSDLRWLEAGALGMPVIADPNVYPEIEHGVNGFHAEDPKDASEILRTLLADGDLRDRVGQAARDYVECERASDTASAQWFEVCSAAAGGHQSMLQLARS